jgi:hypothetical protein
MHTYIHTYIHTRTHLDVSNEPEADVGSERIKTLQATLVCLDLSATQVLNLPLHGTKLEFHIAQLPRHGAALLAQMLTEVAQLREDHLEKVENKKLAKKES